MKPKTIDELRFDENGLLPAVVRDADAGTVLMMAWVNEGSLRRTLETGEMYFFSRSRQKLWRKGETSGNVLRVRRIAVDCDFDCLLVDAEPAGPVCHTGARSCFFGTLTGETPSESLFEILGGLSRTIRERHEERPEGSYTTSLFEGGVDRIAQKVGEEATEVVIAAAKDDGPSLAEESADLLYHLLVLWRAAGLEPDAIARVLGTRRGKMPGDTP